MSPDLVQFAERVMANMQECNIEDYDLQELALECGLLTKVTVTEPCGDDCKCAEYYGEFPAVCHQRVPLQPTPPAPEPSERVEQPPSFWKHAIDECNAAHVALDKLGAPKTKSVRRVRGPDGNQDITIGLAERIATLTAEQTRLREALATIAFDEEVWASADMIRAAEAALQPPTPREEPKP